MARNCVPEKVGATQRIANTAKTEERVDLLLDSKMRPLFIASNIERANNEEVMRHRRQASAIWR